MRSVGTLTRADLAETINRKMGFSRAESLDMVEAILKNMCDALSDGENVKISGFGSFVLRDKNERVGRNLDVPLLHRGFARVRDRFQRRVPRAIILVLSAIHAFII